MDTIRIVRDTGDVSRLSPEGWCVADLPFTVFDAVLQALHFLAYETLDKDDQPPKNIWLDGKKMSAWWEERNRANDEKWGLNGKKQIEGPVSTNAAAEGLIVGG